MALLELQGVTLGYGGPPLLEAVDLRLDPGERIALVGRNGSGKSTLLQLIHGDLTAQEGGIVRQPKTRVALLEQRVPAAVSGTVYDVVAAGLGEVGGRIAEYHRLSHELASTKGDPAPLLGRLEAAQHALEEVDGWRLPNRVAAVLSRLSLGPESQFSSLSGGLKRRVLLGRALVSEPDLLLLDEPTNHLDVASIEALEELVLGLSGALLFVTHDRAFLRRLATRIVELDRGRLTDWPGDYDAYVAAKAKLLEVEAKHDQLFDKHLAKEEAWIRQGIKARRTRNEGRVKALERMRAERRARRPTTGDVKLRLDEGEGSGKRVIEVTGLSFDYGGEPLIHDFSTQILRGDKIAVLGKNGSGKTTLLRLLLGELEPLAGTVRLGSRLEVAYFDQHRAQLDVEASVADNVSHGNDRITIGGKTRHVIGYLQDFLFPPARASSPVKSLSGGERHRLLLARLFARPFNVLVMDEPTNDLDIETLELLEELLLEFEGTLLLVSHDRTLVDNVATGTLVFEGQGEVKEYVGGYSDWLRQRPAEAGAKPAARPPPRKPVRERRRRLTYQERLDMEALPDRIEALEAEQSRLFAQLGEPQFYRRPGSEIAAVRDRLAAVEAELGAAYERWEVLESIELP